MTAYKEAHGEHFSHEVVLFAKVILVRIPSQHIVLCKEVRDVTMVTQCLSKGVWVGRRDTSDEHIVLTPGGRVLSRTIRRLEPTRRHDARFLSVVKGLPWDAQDGFVGREMNQHRHIPSFLIGESTQKLAIGMHDITDELRGTRSAGSHSGSGEETDDSKDVPMNESLSSDGQSQSSGGSHDRSNSKATRHRE